MHYYAVDFWIEEPGKSMYEANEFFSNDDTLHYFRQSFDGDSETVNKVNAMEWRMYNDINGYLRFITNEELTEEENEEIASWAYMQWMDGIGEGWDGPKLHDMSDWCDEIPAFICS